MKPSCLFLSLLLLVLISTEAIARGYPDKIIIQGGNLERPIELSDRQILGKFSPWYGQFIDWTNSPLAKPNDRPTYEVLFYVSWRDRKSPGKPPQLKLIFSFLYIPDPAGGPGLIYLPSRSDDKYRVNQATIMRDKYDGKWLQASVAWEEALKPLLPVKSQSVAAGIVTPPQSNFWLSMMVGLSAAGLGFVLVTAEIIRRKHSTGNRTL
jgi:hypothetical protein